MSYFELLNLRFFIILLFVPIIFSNAYAHTIDSIDDKYRIEIGWMREPVVSGETNGIELYISTLRSCPNILDSIKCAESQEFNEGITGLDKTLKMQLVYKTETIMLPLEPDHNISGKYYAFVDPTVSGYYQANILGKINDTTVSLSMHPPKVDERSYIEFPKSSDVTMKRIIDSHTRIIKDISDLKESLDNLEQEKSPDNIVYVTIGIAVTAIIMSSIAFVKQRK